MAFNRRKINPLDLQPRKAIGVSLPLSGKSVFNGMIAAPKIYDFGSKIYLPGF